jgi:hypothetical protein
MGSRRAVTSGTAITLRRTPVVPMYKHDIDTGAQCRPIRVDQLVDAAAVQHLHVGRLFLALLPDRRTGATLCFDQSKSLI